VYPSDASDAEWALIGPLLPVPACQTAAGGRPEQHRRRVVVDAIRYVIHNGCVWRALPADFPPFMWNQKTVVKPSLWAVPGPDG
jgi:putative transposase